ncbi:MAG: hypothetical protein NT012_02675 [Candidatus Nealsonbacteria bacterium]|nr:hypothetical protein [Candidatus Nealsonbacteria bacterium]
MESAREKLIKLIVAGQKSEENKKFGEFIVQTNKVQFYLSILVVLQSFFPDKKYREYVEGAEFGSVINLFCACGKNEEGTVKFIKRLRKYKKQRNRLAHKMFSAEKLTKKECEQAIIEGEKILKDLSVFIKEKLPGIEI